MFRPTAEFTKKLAAEIVRNLSSITEKKTWRSSAPTETIHPVESDAHVQSVLIDTSVLIDGRIVQIVQSGFFAGKILIPQFILGEVQHIADSSDAFRRSKGRRGLEVAAKLREQKVNTYTTTAVVTDDVDQAVPIDQKLITLAKINHMSVLTVDFNLAQSARVQGVRVLNVNDLGQAMKVALVPGEPVIVKLTHPGKERTQGVGYLGDGTMVIVEEASIHVGKDVNVIVTKVHQTPAGQLFFAKLQK